MGKLIRLTGVNFVGAPKLKQFDEIEAFGSLALFDSSLVSGLPVAGDQVTNALSELTREVTGATSDLDFTVRTKVDNNANWLLERTTKGGFHGIIKQSTGNTTAINMVFNAPRAVRNYMLANPSHQYYVSLWTKVTKNALSSAAIQSPFHFCTDVSGLTNGFFNSGNGFFNDVGGNRSNLLVSPTANDVSVAVPSNRFASAQYSGIVNNGQALTTAHDIQFGVGSFGPWNTTSADKGASRVLYRAYIEDLTVSGRTAAQVSAIDQAIFNKEFADGGKFYNDTYTNPNSL